jgi:hypothetical protein
MRLSWRCHRPDLVLAGKEEHPRPGNPVPVTQQLQQPGRQHGEAIPAALALLDADQHALAVDVRDLEGHCESASA